MKANHFLKCLFVLVTMGGAGPLFAQEKSWEGEAVSGSVAEVVYRVYDVRRPIHRAPSTPSFRLSAAPRETRIFTYSPSGKILTRVALGDKGQDIVRWEMTYDSEGKLLTESRFEGMQLQSKTTFRYGTNKLLSSIEFFYAGAPKDITRTTFTYDEAGHAVEERRTDPAGKVYGQTMRKYDAEGELAEEEIKEGSVSTKATWTRDGFYRVETLERRVDGVLQDRAVTHLSAGKKVSVDAYDAVGNVTASVDYEQEDLRTTELIRTGEGGGTHVTEVDGLGNLISAAYDDRGQDYTFEFDEHDNWVRQTVWSTYQGRRSGNPEQIITRQIRYLPGSL